MAKSNEYTLLRDSDAKAFCQQLQEHSGDDSIRALEPRRLRHQSSR